MANDRVSTYIGGYSVQFPYKPYGPQLTFMGKVISTLEASRVKGNANALLESPTGSGKTLALLCASLAWQKFFKEKKLVALKQEVSPSEANGAGGGFVQEGELRPRSHQLAG